MSVTRAKEVTPEENLDRSKSMLVQKSSATS
jgi:hypothetical protein